MLFCTTYLTTNNSVCQKVPIAATCVVCQLPKYSHISSVLKDLHSVVYHGKYRVIFEISKFPMACHPSIWRILLEKNRMAVTTFEEIRKFRWQFRKANANLLSTELRFLTKQVLCFGIVYLIAADI